jgi:hypothetical protein
MSSQKLSSSSDSSSISSESEKSEDNEAEVIGGGQKNGNVRSILKPTTGPSGVQSQPVAAMINKQ